MIEVGQVYQIQDHEDEWDGEKVIIKDVNYNRLGQPEYVLVRADGEVAPSAGGAWSRRCLKRLP